jgi:cysteine-rich repeat protein
MPVRLALPLCALCASLALPGCGGDGGDPDSGIVLDGGGEIDAGGGGDCTGAANGEPCGDGRICLDGVCNEDRCGDGFTSATEECDDGNNVAFDGCEPSTCTFTCSDDSDCDNGQFCDGTETCTGSVCSAGTPPGAGDPCPRAGMADGVCRFVGPSAMCVDAGCGNGTPDGEEECDDGNAVPGDGCELDCTFSCVDDSDCLDADACNGTERCNTANHVCETTGEPDCDDGNDCTVDTCDALVGCVRTLTDVDGDGHASRTIGECGDDCDDNDPTTYEGAPELCEVGAAVDNDCDPSTPNPSASLWYLDCDEDGYAADGADSVLSCAMPTPQDNCGFTTRIPQSSNPATFDCNDSNDDMFPGQTMYFTSAHSSGANDDERFGDYNCNGNAEEDRTTANNRDSTCEPVWSGSGIFGRVSCSGEGWITTSTVGCGFSGMFTDCGGATRCTDTDIRLCPRGCDTICVAEDRRQCTVSCAPNSRDCPHQVWCCSQTVTSTRLACR